MDSRLLQKIRKMADDEDWMVREDAAVAIREINDEHFEEYLPLWKEWVGDPNPNIRRALEVGLLRINKRYYQEAFELLVSLLDDGEGYVRKSCGPFALSAVACRNPEETFERFRELAKEEDQNVRWNIAMCLGVMFGTRYPQPSIALLRVLAWDERRFVWRAVASSLIKLLRRFPEYRGEVYSWKGADHVLEVVKRLTEE